MAADIPIYPCCSRGIDKIDVAGIECLEFGHQLPALAQLIFLVIVFGQIEPPERLNFSLYFFVSATLLEGLGFHCLLFLGFVVVINCRLILTAPGAGGRIMFTPKNI